MGGNTTNFEPLIEFERELVGFGEELPVILFSCICNMSARLLVLVVTPHKGGSQL